MTYINYFEYADVNNFKNNSFNHQKNLAAPNIKLVHTALTLSLTYSNNKDTFKKYIKLNSSLISVLLETFTNESGRRIYTKTDAYDNAESTFKTSFSFYMGMLFASFVAKEIYNIPLVYHVNKNNKFAVGLTNKKSSPDFIGVLNNNGYIFEAKGSSKEITNTTASNGKAQLNNITSLSHLNPSSTQASTTIPINYKQVIGTDFTYNNSLTVHNIDPTPKGKLELDLDSLSLLYYRNHILLFDIYMEEAGIENYEELLTIHYEYNSYYIIPHMDVFIGIEFSLYEYLKKRKKYYYEDLEKLPKKELNKNILSNSHSEINQIISEIVIDDKNNSLEYPNNLVYKGRDGVLVIQRNEKSGLDKKQHIQELQKLKEKLNSEN